MKNVGPRHYIEGLLLCLLLVIATAACLFGEETAKVTVNWQKVVRVSKTTATLQVVINPPLRRGSAMHDRTFEVLRDLKCDYVRYVPWLPYPRLGVAELEPPQDGKTSWDFSLIDPLTIDFLDATEGHSVILNFSTIPQWMFKTPKPIPYPADPDQVVWNYEQGTEFRDPSLKELGDYYARLVSWYTQGGFTDEYGKRHDSAYHYKVPYWEILNEVDFEHNMTPETYTRVYDAIAGAIRGVDPQMKFVGLALAAPSKEPRYFEYFLDPRNHRPGIPLDMISYHFYATPGPDQSPEVQQFTFFEQADHFLDVVRYIDSIRQRLSPATRTTIDEIGSISADDGGQDQPGHVTKPIPNSYWTLSGAMYAYVFVELAKMGIDIAGESQLVGYPTQFPSVTMVDWNTGEPNAHYWVLKLLRDNFAPGDKMLESNSGTGFVVAQAFETRDGKRKILFINKRDRTFVLTIAGGSGAQVEVVDQATAFKPPAASQLSGDQLTLNGLAVAVVTLPK